MFKPSKMSMLAFPKLIHVPVNLLYCLKAVGSQVLWFFIFCQRVKSVVSPLLLFTVALCGTTSRGPQCQGSDALDPAIPSLSREVREAGLSCLISPQAGSGSSKNNPSVMEALLPCCCILAQVEGRDADGFFLVVTLIPPHLPTSLCVGGTAPHSVT